MTGQQEGGSPGQSRDEAGCDSAQPNPGGPSLRAVDPEGTEKPRSQAGSATQGLQKAWVKCQLWLWLSG